MPIRPSEKARYPTDWKIVSVLARERAGDRCQGTPQFPTCRVVNGKAHPDTGSVVVLTVAHMDDTPENSTDQANLRALCQRCHLNYDAKHHARNAAATRRARANTRELF